MSRLDTNLILTDRDMLVFREISRFHFLLARHIRFLAGFQSLRVCERRLTKLCKFTYLEKRHILVGIAPMYFLGKNAKKFSQLKYYTDKQRLDEIDHDIAVIDSVIYFMDTMKIPLSDFVTERQLHALDGFARRKHRPDFVFTNAASERICVEIEFTAKSKAKLKDNLRDNFLNYDRQIWIVPENERKLLAQIKDISFQNTEFLVWEEVKEYVSKIE